MYYMLLMDEPLSMPAEKKPFLKTNLVLLAISTIVFLLLSALLLYFYLQNQTLQKKLQHPNSASKDEVSRLVSQVGKHIELPKEETPTVATVSDANKLKNQAFFEKAVKGDKLLIFTNAKKAILFRPSTDKIIDVAPVNLDQQTKNEPVKVVLYNGTTVTGLTREAEQQIKNNLKNIAVVSKENAHKKDYEKSIVVDLTGKNKITAEELTKLVKGEAGSLPEGEVKPEADILVILGSDYPNQ